MKIPTLESMLKAGMHFGHRASKWHPKMAHYIFGQRNKRHVIDLRLTQKALEEKFEHIANLVSKGGVILFVGTKLQAQQFVKEQAERCGMPYIKERWIGGLLTNFSVVGKLSKKFTDLKKKKETGELAKYTKKEQLDFQREIEKLDRVVGGIEHMNTIPQALFVVDIKHDKTAVSEAKSKKIEVIAICDTNVNPDPVDHIIPANDDAVRSIEMVASFIADAVLEGKKRAEEKKA